MRAAIPQRTSVLRWLQRCRPRDGVRPLTGQHGQVARPGRVVGRGAAQPLLRANVEVPANAALHDAGTKPPYELIGKRGEFTVVSLGKG